ncbi:MAG TPA: CheR family methyltransferase [Polyangiaceae bacterium]|nr:CheR family methyltransferase [Polyangiaceae bacterium]
MARRAGEGEGPAGPGAGGEGPAGPGAGGEAAARLIAAVRRATGVDVAPFKREALVRKLLELSAAEGAATLDEYAARLEGDPAAAAKAAGALLNKTTSMFRDPAAFGLLRATLPELLARRRGEGSTALRAWVAACATGEEAYSIAMCLADEIERQGAPMEPSVVASDVDAAALARAASGLVDEAGAARVPAPLAERWLVREGAGRRVAPGLRARVRFARHDLISSPLPAPAEAAFASFDLVSCRNLLIYLEPSAREGVLARLVKACARGALLWLGDAEWAPESFAGQLAPVAGPASLYWVTP